MKIQSKRKNAAEIGINCFLAYMACYVARNMLSAVSPQLKERNLFDEAAIGQMGSALLLSYGVGQLINGVIGDKIKAKYMIGIGLAAAGLLTAAFAVCPSVGAATVLWGMCGFFCSMLWGPITKLIAENTERSTGRILMLMMTVASTAGIQLTYALALCSAISGNYRLPFFLAGILIVAIALLDVFLCLHLERKGAVRPPQTRWREKSQVDYKKLFCNVGFFSMIMVSVLNGVIRNAVAFWIPMFISQNFALNSKITSTISTVLPFVNLTGLLLSMYVAKRIHYREKHMCVALFTLASVMFGVMLLCGSRFAAVSITALFLAIAAMAGASNMIFSIYVLHFKNTGIVSGVSGFVDFSAYLFASAASLLFPVILENGGWSAVMGSWLLAAVIGGGFALLALKTDKAELLDQADAVIPKKPAPSGK